MRTPPRPLATAYRTLSVPAPSARDPDALVEVRALWSDEVLTVAHLDDGDRFVLSSRGASEADPRRVVLPSLTRDRELVRVRGEIVTVTPVEGPSFELDDEATLRCDGVTLEVRRVPRGERLPRPKRDRFFGASAALALVVTGVLARVPPPRRADGIKRDDGEQSWILKRIVPRVHTAYQPVRAETAGVDQGGDGRRAFGDEGRAGRARSAPSNRRWVLRPSTPRPAAASSLADLTRTRGILGSLSSLGASTTRFMPQATESVAQTGNMYGDDVGVARGDNGLGLLGIGFGGGGTGEGLIGLGRFHTRGHGDRTSAGQGLGGSGWGCGCADLAGRASINTHAGFGVMRGAVRSGSPVVCGVRSGSTISDPPCANAETGGVLDAAMVRRVVRANLGQIKHCYERALEANPSAEGSIAMRWVIGPNGDVLSAAVEESSIAVASFSECVTSAVRRWRFTVPSDTVATVRYPFTLAREE